MNSNLLARIEEFGQPRILRFWNDLTESEQIHLTEQLDDVEWSLVGSYLSGLANPVAESQNELGNVAPPTHVVRTPKTNAEIQFWDESRQLGEAALREGKVGVVLLAGGQGTRLGFSHPKGMFPIGPVSGKSLFELFASQVKAISNRFGQTIPYMMMTSDATHDETVTFFEQNSYFGLSSDNVFFFKQGYAPCLDTETGELLLADKGALSMSPDGHGGLLAALLKAGLFDELRHRGIELLFLHQVDNPLVKVCDPAFLGLHIQHGAEVSTKVVSKSNPEEKVGVAVDLNGRTAIIEYCDLPRHLADEQDANGGLRYWAGSTAIHIFNRSFLERIATSAQSLPWHRARKKIPFIDKAGRHVQPETENGTKFERFLFDTLPLAEVALIVETIRDDEFAPLKNKNGDFSPEYVRRHMIEVAARWLKTAGVTLPKEIPVEISPYFALSASDLMLRSNELKQVNWGSPVYLEPAKSLSHQEKSHTFDLPASETMVTDPLVFDTYYRPQIWGGRGLSTLLRRKLPTECPYGEAWDLSPQALHVSRVTNGPLLGRDLNDLWTNYRSLLSGGCGPASFPLLVKWLECRELLSLQVHPDDRMAQQILNEPFGKSEAWVVVTAEPTARVYAGLKPGVTRSTFESHINAGTLIECLHSFVPVAGDCISLPAGTIHAAGGGLIVAEVQQSSDATFRLYDWNRLGLDGNPRPLQVDLALGAINWDQGAISPVTPQEIPSACPKVKIEQLVSGPSFQLERYIVEESLSSPHSGELTIWLVLDGKAGLFHPITSYRREFDQGSTVVIPASAGEVIWVPLHDERPLTLLCTRLPDTHV